MKQWEYKTMKMGTKGAAGGILDTTEFDSLLNQLGQEGWELVTSFDTNSFYGSSREVVAIFKREQC